MCRGRDRRAWRLTREMDGKLATPDRVVAEIARRQHGVVSVSQLHRCGITDDAIRSRAILGRLHRRDRTRSDLESDFIELCRRHRLPPPEVNVRVGAYLADFLWRERRLIVETDFYLYHRGRVAFQDDRGRDLELRQLGYEVVRLSESRWTRKRIWWLRSW